MIIKGVLTRERFWSETSLLFHSRTTMPVMARSMLEAGDDSDYPALLRCRGTVTGRTLIGSYAGATFGLRLIAVEHNRRGEACG